MLDVSNGIRGIGGIVSHAHPATCMYCYGRWNRARKGPRHTTFWLGGQRDSGPNNIENAASGSVRLLILSGVRRRRAD